MFSFYIKSAKSSGYFSTEAQNVDLLRVWWVFFSDHSWKQFDLTLSRTVRENNK